MVAFINMFLTYLILVVASVGVIILGVFCGKKLSDRKEKKNAADEQVNEEK